MGYQQWCFPSLFDNQLWLVEMLLKTLVNRLGGVNSSGFRVMTVGTKANGFHGVLWGCVDVVDEKCLGV